MAYLGAEQTTQLKPDFTRLRRLPDGKLMPLRIEDLMIEDMEDPVVTEVGDNSTPVLETEPGKKTNWVLWIGAAVAVWWFFIRKK